MFISKKKNITTEAAIFCFYILNGGMTEES